MAEPAPEVLREARAIFGGALAEQMGYSDGAGVALAEELDLRLEGTDVTMRFRWCGREMVGSLDDISELQGVVEHFALDVADDLQEHRGRGEVLPWDER